MKNGKGILILLLILIIVFPFLTSSPFYIHMLLMIFIYAAAAQAWNILGGLTGYISLGHAMFFGTGAYASSILMIKLGINPWIGMCVGGLLAAFLSQTIAWPLLRLSGHYFAVATIVINEILMTIFVNWDFCGGAAGCWLPILDDGILNMQFSESKTPYYFIGLMLLIVVFGITFCVQKTKLGYYLRAINSEADTSRARGINNTLYKSISLGLSAFLTGIIGAFYAQYVFCIDPRTVFHINISLMIALIPILGGLGTLWGPLLGAALLIPLGEVSRAYFGGGERALDQIIYGLLIMVIAVYQPKGLVGIFEQFKGRRSQSESA